MPIYKPESETMTSNSAQSGQEVDNDYSNSSVINPDLSTLEQFSIELSINGSLRDTSVIPANLTENLTTLVVTIRKK